MSLENKTISSSGSTDQVLPASKQPPFASYKSGQHGLISSHQRGTTSPSSLSLVRRPNIKARSKATARQRSSAKPILATLPEQKAETDTDKTRGEKPPTSPLKLPNISELFWKSSNPPSTTTDELPPIPMVRERENDMTRLFVGNKSCTQGELLRLAESDYTDAENISPCESNIQPTENPPKQQIALSFHLEEKKEDIEFAMRGRSEVESSALTLDHTSSRTAFAAEVEAEQLSDQRGVLDGRHDETSLGPASILTKEQLDVAPVWQRRNRLAVINGSSLEAMQQLQTFLPECADAKTPVFSFSEADLGIPERMAKTCDGGSVDDGDGQQTFQTFDDTTVDDKDNQTLQTFDDTTAAERSGLSEVEPNDPTFKDVYNTFNQLVTETIDTGLNTIRNQTDADLGLSETLTTTFDGDSVQNLDSQTFDDTTIAKQSNYTGKEPTFKDVYRSFNRLVAETIDSGLNNSFNRLVTETIDSGLNGIRNQPDADLELSKTRTTTFDVVTEASVIGDTQTFDDATVTDGGVSDIGDKAFNDIYNSFNQLVAETIDSGLRNIRNSPTDTDDEEDLTAVSSVDFTSS